MFLVYIKTYNQGVEPKLFLNNFRNIYYIKNFKNIKSHDKSIEFTDDDLKKLKDYPIGRK